MTVPQHEPFLNSSTLTNASNINQTTTASTGNGHSLSLGMNLIVILAGLLCALFFAISFSAVLYLLLLRLRGRQAQNSNSNSSSNNNDVEKQVEGKEMAAIPVLVFSAAGGGGEQAECAICLAEFVDGDAVRVLPACSHGFHVGCIQRWLAGHTNCPTCRTSCSVPEMAKESS